MCQVVFYYLLFYGIIWVITKIFQSFKSNDTYTSQQYKRDSGSDGFYNYSQGQDSRRDTEDPFMLRIKPMIMGSIYILYSCNIQPYLRKNILQEMYGKNVLYRREIFDFIEDHYMKNPGFIKYYTEMIKRNFDYTNRVKYLRNQVRMLINARVLNQFSINIISQLALDIGLSQREVIILLNEFQYTDYSRGQGERGRYREKDPYKVLGLSSDASLRDVKNAYIKLVSKYHPDRYLNKSEDEKRNAEEKMKDIN
ncbi:MAG TPA: hypothetical protein ENN73_06170, partial [Firmicutes bacterium]|nr:hypothetical protein [Bacillota bacterium]